MTLTRQEMLDYARDWAAKRDITIRPGSLETLSAIFDQAVPRISERLAHVRGLTQRDRRGAVSLQVEGALDILLETMRASATDGQFHENSGPDALMRLGPGWWPFT